MLEGLEDITYITLVGGQILTASELFINYRRGEVLLAKVILIELMFLIVIVVLVEICHFSNLPIHLLNRGGGPFHLILMVFFLFLMKISWCFNEIIHANA
jgi:hypothetical protein